MRRCAGLAATALVLPIAGLSRRLARLLVLPAAILAAPAAAQELPPEVGALLREANPQERNTLRDVMKRLYPSQREAIDDLIDDIEDEEKAQVAKSRLIEGWTGEGSLGANYSSGNTNEWDFSAALNIRRKGPRWEHRLDVGIDFSEVDDERTEERVAAGYRARRDFTDSPWFAFGALSYDRDRFQGISNRFTESAGVGYELIDTDDDAEDDVDWDIYAGPAFRQTDLIDSTHEEQLGVFIATDLKWEITDTLTLREYAGAVVTKRNTSFRSVTSLTNNLYGQLSARFDLTIETETDPPEGAEKTDIYSRVSLVYDF